MYWSIHLREGKVILPTTIEYPRSGHGTVEPVSVVDVKNTDALRKEIEAVIDRGNPVRPVPKSRDELPELVEPKAVGVKSWLAYVRKTRAWGIQEKNGVYSIIPYRDYTPSSWKQDDSQIERFPAGTSIATVIDRMTAILQAAATR